jgi:cell division protein FtsL
MGAKQWVVLAAVVVVCVFGVVATKSLIKQQVAQQTQEIQENHAKQLAEEKLKCETSKLEMESALKKHIVEIEAELEKTKIILEKIQKQGRVTETIKNDVKGFMKDFDALIGTKGKANEQAK